MEFLLASMHCRNLPSLVPSPLSCMGRHETRNLLLLDPLCHEALGAWQEIKGEAMSVNEALYAGTRCDRGDCMAGRKLTMV